MPGSYPNSDIDLQSTEATIPDIDTDIDNLGLFKLKLKWVVLSAVPNICSS